jgi:hypothetical protein
LFEESARSGGREKKQRRLIINIDKIIVPPVNGLCESPLKLQLSHIYVVTEVEQ